MITAIQAVPNVDSYSALPNLGRISFLTQGTNSSFSMPSTILSLGTVSSVPLTYNAAGQFESLSQVVGSNDNSAATALAPATTASVFNAMNILQGVSSDSSGRALSNLLSTDLVRAAAAPDATGKSPLTQLASDMIQAAAPLGSTGTTATTATISSDNTGATAQVASAGTIAATPVAVASAVPVTSATPAMVEATSAAPVATATASNATINSPYTPTITVIAENDSGTAADSSTMASSLLADAAAQTLSSIASDPAYANMAAALYMNAAIFRSQHGSDVAPANTSRSIQPVRELHAIYPV